MQRRKTNNLKLKFNLKQWKVYVLGTICGLMAIAAIFMTIESATNGAEVASLQTKEAVLMSQQQELQQALVENLSINTLQETSAQLGFGKIGKLVYVTDTESVAKLP